MPIYITVHSLDSPSFSYLVKKEQINFAWTRNSLLMASSNSMLMMLFLLVGIGACVAIEGISGQGTNVGKETAVENLGRVTMPSILMDYASPLDTKAASLYAAKIEDGSIAQHAKDFCTEAKLLCDADVNLVDPSLDISLKSLLEGGNLLERAKAMVDASQAMFFGPKDLVAGKDIKMPTTFHDQYPTTSFLPESLAKLMPLSGDKIAELLQKLNIPPTSNLAVMMSRTMSRCDAKTPRSTTMSTKESSEGMCVTSMEDMTKFVADRFPQDTRINALERTIPAATDAAPFNAKTGTSTFKVLDVKEYEHSVVCHKNMFPFAVYECHNMDINKDKNVEDNMKLYAVAMESHEDGRRMNQIASCRADAVGTEKTRKIVPGPLATEAAACHWLSDAFVWAPTTGAETKH
ncbi:hypothetical protein KC19_6G204200 [Ceratodon purpureus]|uniref:BURP domain-containing protein n=1 Tax=Ceratodon purpureus TaxID=3225 RepID=A0A8T0HJP9_CERPU|nr:hypothetical protein KC19_6G204200 [Ceratodon purpureus]